VYEIPRLPFPLNTFPLFLLRSPVFQVLAVIRKHPPQSHPHFPPFDCVFRCLLDFSQGFSSSPGIVIPDVHCPTRFASTLTCDPSLFSCLHFPFFSSPAPPLVVPHRPRLPQSLLSFPFVLPQAFSNPNCLLFFFPPLRTRRLP